MEIAQPLIHYSLHLLFPGVIARLFFRKKWKKAWLIMLATMLVDLDHIYACKDIFTEEGSIIWGNLFYVFSCDTLFVEGRCSIGFHPLHSYIAIGIYFLMSFFPKIRIIAIGLLFHMLTDFLDCLWM